MPLFFFNLRVAEETIDDTDGADLACLQEAYSEGMAAARQMVAEMNAACIPLDDNFVEVCNPKGDLLISIQLSKITTLN